MDQQLPTDINQGQAVLGLSEACGESPAGFSVPIYKNGSEIGEIKGQIHIVGLVSVHDNINRFFRIMQKSQL